MKNNISNLLKEKKFQQKRKKQIIKIENTMVQKIHRMIKINMNYLNLYYNA